MADSIPKYTDAVFEIKTTMDTLSIPVHRSILCDFEYFENLFKYTQPEWKSSVIDGKMEYKAHYTFDLKILDPDTVKFFFQFIYNEHTPIQNLNVSKVFYLTSYFQIPFDHMDSLMQDILLNLQEANDVDLWNEFLMQIVNSGFDDNIKQSILLRYYNSIGEENKTKWESNFKDFIPKNYFGLQYNPKDENSPIILQQSITSYNGRMVSHIDPTRKLEIQSYYTFAQIDGETSIGFWIQGLPIGEKEFLNNKIIKYNEEWPKEFENTPISKAKITLLVFDPLSKDSILKLRKKEIHSYSLGKKILPSFPNPILSLNLYKNRNRYGKTFDDSIITKHSLLLAYCFEVKYCDQEEEESTL